MEQTRCLHTQVWYKELKVYEVYIINLFIRTCKAIWDLVAMKKDVVNEVEWAEKKGMLHY